MNLRADPAMQAAVRLVQPELGDRQAVDADDLVAREQTGHCRRRIRMDPMDHEGVRPPLKGDADPAGRDAEQLVEVVVHADADGGNSEGEAEGAGDRALLGDGAEGDRGAPAEAHERLGGVAVLGGLDGEHVRRGDHGRRSGAAGYEGVSGGLPSHLGVPLRELALVLVFLTGEFGIMSRNDRLDLGRVRLRDTLHNVVERRILGGVEVRRGAGVRGLGRRCGGSCRTCSGRRRTR